MTHANRRRLRAALIVIGLAVTVLFGITMRQGYWGGGVFTFVPATAPRTVTAPGAGTPPLAAVFVSGDAGFGTGMGVRIANRLAARGIPTLGVNSLRAFASRRSPAETEALVRDAAATALERSGAARLVLIGQSFGANALLQGVGALPAPLRARVAAVVFVVPATTQLLHASPMGLLDFGRNDGPSAGLARHLDWAPVLCLHGAEEEDSLCPRWRAGNVRSVTLPGDHYLRHDDAAVTRAILAALGGGLPRVHAAQSSAQR